MLRLGILILLCKTHVREMASTKLSEQLKRRGVIREQEEAGGGIFLEPNLPIMNASVEPMPREAEAVSDLCQGEGARNGAGMGLMAGNKATVLQAQPLHGTH